MDKVMDYFTGFFRGLIGIMMTIIPVTILWTLLTGATLFNLDFISNFMDMITMLGNNGFVGLLALIFIMYFFLCDKCGIPKDCKK
jgi:Na+/H+ antiporter NhaC